MSESNLAQALLNAQNDFETVKKDHQGVHNSKYAPLESLQKASYPALRKSGLVHQFCTKTDEAGRVLIISRLKHAKSDSVDECSLPISKFEDLKAHDRGSIISYSRRYLYSGHVGLIVEGEDDDGNAAQGVPSSSGGNAQVGPKGNPNSPGSIIFQMVNDGKVSWDDIADVSTRLFGKAKFKELEPGQKAHVLQEIEKMLNAQSEDVPF
jgi:hypothetical protein